MAKIPGSGSILPFGGLWPIMMIAAFLGFSLPAAKEEDSSKKEKPAETGKQAANAGTPPAKPNPAGLCGGDIDGVLREYFGECGSKEEFPPEKIPRFLLLTVPDPEIRSLRYLSESFLDSFRLAMNAEGYVPFSIGPMGWPPAKSGDNAKARPDQGSPPGIWLFAKPPEKSGGNRLVMALLIGEDPVSGIDRRQFAEAVSKAGILSVRAKNELLLLGPTFSGSARSLALAIEKAGPLPHILAASGTAALSDLGKVFQQSEALKTGISWNQLAVPDPLGKAIKHINQRYGNPSLRVLSEAHTLYGAHVAGLEQLAGREKVDVTYLPRDLSLLRAAYRAHPNLYQRIFPVGNVPSGLLPAPLSADGSVSEMPVYMGETMAKSQETSLVAFARRLKAERVEFLGIQVTDRLDALFLARFFAEESPNVRIFLIGSDVLFNIGASRGSLTGTLTFSSYPIGAAGKDHLPQANDAAAGFGEAAKFLVKTPHSKPVPLGFYYSVIGRGGEWPIEATESKGREWTVPARRSGPLIAFLGCLLLATFLPLGRWAISAGIVPANRFSCALGRVCHRLAPYALNPYIPRDDPQGPRTSDETVKGREIKRKRWLIALAVIWISLAVLAGDILHHHFDASGSVSSMRYTALTSGVNPLIPCVCFLLSWYSFVWMRIRGRFIDNYSFHVLPFRRSGDSEANPVTLDNPAIAESCLELIATMQSGFSFWGLAGCSGAVLAFLLAYNLHITCVEGKHQPGDLMWTVLAVGTYATALATLCYFMRVWVLLFSVLRKLESHPIRNAFTRLPDRISWTTIWTVGGLRPTFVSLQLVADYLAILLEKLILAGNANPSEANPSLCEQIAKTQDLAASVLNSSYAAKFPDKLDSNKKAALTGVLLKLQQECQLIACQLQDDLAPAWKASRLEGWRGASIDYASAEQRAKFYALGAIESVRNSEVSSLWTQVRKLKEEFLALLFSSYIRYVFVQLRNLAGSAAISVSMLFLAINTYPFHPYQGLLNAATFLFFSIGVVFVSVFYQMDIDPLLSRLSDTQSGKLDAGFPKRLLQFGLFPTATYLVSQFPYIGDVFLRLSEVIPGLPK